MHRKKIIFAALLLWMLLFGGGLAGEQRHPEGARVNHRLFAQLLQAHVQEGIVDYRGFKADEKKLDDYLHVLETVRPAQLDPEDQFAFYINAYNAWTIKLILSGYPGINSVWDLGGRVFNKPFARKFILLDGGRVSLDDIENGILRPRFKDPRVHFAINCASKSCPPLRAEPYRGEILNQQLDEATRAFINHPERIFLKGQTLYVSKLFKWFSVDFNEDVVGFVIKYADDVLKEKLMKLKDRTRIEYLDYDWSLNGA